MLTNKQIHTLLLENKGDLKAFQKFVGFKSRNAMEFRLRSIEPKNNLWGQYREFVIERKLKECFNTNNEFQGEEPLFSTNHPSEGGTKIRECDISSTKLSDIIK